MQFLTLSLYLNLYSKACGTAELCTDVCPRGGPPVAAMSKTVLLTGGVGFIGASLFDLCQIAVPPSETFHPIGWHNGLQPIAAESQAVTRR